MNMSSKHFFKHSSSVTFVSPAHLRSSICPRNSGWSDVSNSGPRVPERCARTRHRTGFLLRGALPVLRFGARHKRREMKGGCLSLSPLKSPIHPNSTTDGDGAPFGIIVLSWGDGHIGSKELSRTRVETSARLSPQFQAISTRQSLVAPSWQGSASKRHCDMGLDSSDGVVGKSEPTELGMSSWGRWW